MKKLGPYDINSIVTGDCLKVMEQMPDECVDLVVTSPTYNCGKNYGELVNDRLLWPQYYRWIKSSLHEIHRVLKLGGVLALNLPKEVRIPLSRRTKTERRVEKVGERVDLLCEDIGFLPREVIIWAKGSEGNAICPVYAMGSDNNIYIRSVSEMILLHSKGRYWYDGGTGRRGAKDVPFLEESKDVWWIPTAPLNGHPCSFPEEIPSRLMQMFTNLRPDKDFYPIVFDPFIGSGTTAVAAKKLGRHYFGCDINPDYVAMARQRIAHETLGQQLELEVNA